MAKAGKTESQIATAVKDEYGPLSSHLTYLVGREWRRVNKVGRHFGTTAKAAKDNSQAGSAAYIRQLFAEGISKEAARKKAVAKYPVMATGVHFQTRWNTAERLAKKADIKVSSKPA